MGLFDFLKKSKDTTTSNVGGTASVFKGDLAMVRDMKKKYSYRLPPIPTSGELEMIQDVMKDSQNTTETAHNIKQITSDNEDSADSVVFMTFSDYVKIVWRCPECGTISDGSYDGCVVCGIKR